MEQETEIRVPRGTTVQGAISHFAESQPELSDGMFVGSSGKHVLKTHTVIVNGMGLTAEGQSAVEVKDGDRIFIFLAVTGG